MSTSMSSFELEYRYAVVMLKIFNGGFSAIFPGSTRCPTELSILLLEDYRCVYTLHLCPGPLWHVLASRGADLSYSSKPTISGC